MEKKLTRSFVSFPLTLTAQITPTIHAHVDCILCGSLILDSLPGTNIVDGEEVAIKLESVQTEHPQLLYEAKLYKLLQGGGE